MVAYVSSLFLSGLVALRKYCAGKELVSVLDEILPLVVFQTMQRAFIVGKLVHKIERVQWAVHVKVVGGIWYSK